MLQYMWALSLQRQVGDLDICGHNLPEWDLSTAIPDGIADHQLRLGGHLISVDQIARLMNQKIVRNVLLAGLGFRMNNLLEADAYRRVFRADDLNVQGFGEDYVVLNVRAAEILGNVHADYRPLQFSYYDAVIAAADRQPVFLGQIDESEYSTRLRERYPDAVFQPSGGALVDFETLRRSHQIALSISTFSWLAGWLSSAKTIHYPLVGWMDPLQRPDIDLTPTEDDRYRFYRPADHDRMKWSATREELERLWAPGKDVAVTMPEVQALRHKAARSIRLRQAWEISRTEIRARLGV